MAMAGMAQPLLVGAGMPWQLVRRVCLAPLVGAQRLPAGEGAMPQHVMARRGGTGPPMVQPWLRPVLAAIVRRLVGAAAIVPLARPGKGATVARLFPQGGKVAIAPAMAQIRVAMVAIAWLMAGKAAMGPIVATRPKLVVMVAWGGRPLQRPVNLAHRPEPLVAMVAVAVMVVMAAMGNRPGRAGLVALARVAQFPFRPG